MKIAASIAVGMTVCWVGHSAITIQFSYGIDAGSASPFFPEGSPARQTLEAAGSAIGTYLNDRLTAITPGSGNTWTASFYSPTTGLALGVNNLSIPGDTVLVYVGARNLGAGVLATAGPGASSGTGTAQFGLDVTYRGQDATGATSSSSTSTDFGPWGGSAAFNNTGINWFFDPTGSQTVPSGSFDFYSVALHELGHVLGFGSSLSWDHYLASSPSRFTGVNTVTLNGGDVPVSTPDLGHWSSGTQSFLPGTSTIQAAAMSPSIPSGTRKVLTALDWAGLADVGWSVDASRFVGVPEPEEVAMGAGVLLLVFGMSRRLLSR